MGPAAQSSRPGGVDTGVKAVRWQAGGAANDKNRVCATKYRPAGRPREWFCPGASGKASQRRRRLVWVLEVQEGSAGGLCTSGHTPLCPSLWSILRSTEFTHHSPRGAGRLASGVRPRGLPGLPWKTTWPGPHIQHTDTNDG